MQLRERGLLSRTTLREMTRPQTSGIASIIPDDWMAACDFGMTTACQWCC
jgi:hypothetical protein